jgi:hypothetical protein
MSRASRIACLLVAATLVPASAEAAKMRFGGKSSAKSSPDASASGGKSRSLVIVPGVGGAMAGTAKAADQTPARVPFPPASATLAAPAPALMQITVNDGAKVWCRSEVVVGGFCVLN